MVQIGLLSATSATGVGCCTLEEPLDGLRTSGSGILVILR